MGINDWMERRRKKELERINREIEALKQHGPLYQKEDKGLKSEGKYLKRDTNFGMFVVVGLCLVAIIGLSLFYRQKFTTLSDEYETKLSELNLAQNRLDNLTRNLNETQSKLKFKEKVETDLSTQYTGLAEEKEALEGQISDLEDEVKNKKDEIDSLKTTVQEKDRRLRDIIDCIENNRIEDKEDCL